MSSEARYETGEQRRHERVRLAGRVRLVVDGVNGLAGACGQLTDLSDDGCSARVNRCVEPGTVGRIQVEVRGMTVWFPVVIRWVRPHPEGWSVGAQFDRPTAEKRAIARWLVNERRRNRPSALLS